MNKDYRHLDITFSSLIGGRYVQTTQKAKVEIMAIVGNYAMVRRKGCAPFICSAADLKKD